MSNTVINQGKTIDQIDSIDEKITDADKKAAFIGNGVLPLNGPAGGEPSATSRQTLGVPVSELVPDVSGKADKSELSITDVTGDATKKNIQLKAGTSTEVVVAHQDLSQYYTKSESNEAFVSKTGYVAYTTDEKNKLGGIETGAEVNKIESISIGDTELEPDENKNVNIKLGSWLYTDEDNRIFVSPNYGAGTGGLSFNDGELCVKYDKKTIERDVNNNLSVNFDNTLTIVNIPSGPDIASYLSVANPVPDNTTGEGAILCWQSGSDFLGIEPHAVWCSPDSNDILVDTTNGEIRLAVPVPDPKGLHPANDGDVLTYDGNTDEIVWAAPQGGGIELPPLPTENATGGGLDETMTRIKLVGECNYEDHFTLKWEYE